MAIKKKTVILPELLTLNQKKLAHSILTKDLTIAYGPAGTGKSFIPAAYAAYFYATGKVDKIVLIRPTVPVGKGEGFLPGDLWEKMEPWMISFLSVLKDHLTAGEVDCMLKNGKIEVVPISLVRGRTFDGSFVVIDEAQNTSVKEATALVTRIGEDTYTVINGDTKQSDLKTGEQSGLDYLINLIKNPRNEELAAKVGLVEFNSEDCVRSGLCRLFLQAFERA